VTRLYLLTVGLLVRQFFLIVEILGCYKQQCHSPFALPKNYSCNNFEKLCVFIKIIGWSSSSVFDMLMKSMEVLNELSLG